MISINNRILCLALWLKEFNHRYYEWRGSTMDRWVGLDQDVPSPIYKGWEKLGMEIEWVGDISHP